MISDELSTFSQILGKPSGYGALSDEQRMRLGALLRDRFFELSFQSPADERANTAFRDLVRAIDPEMPWQLQGLAISYHPTARFQALRFVEADALDEGSRTLFARPCAELPNLAAVFVDPEEYSFRTFENIVPLDRAFGSQLEVALEDRNKLGAKETQCYTFAVRASATTRAALEKLDRLGLYVPPLNAVSRGGSRFIFHSARLAEALGVAVRAAMPKSLLGGFQHVNPVFRCNRFEPNDAKFGRHHDTPYYDSARGHVSRYTLILYVTGGQGDPALRVGEDVALERIEPLTCVVFDQAYPHEGKPYADGRKVFLRTELVFEAGDVQHEPSIAEAFAKATYFTGESVFSPDLAKWADDCYERAAAAHFEGTGARAKSTRKKEPFVHKEFRGVHYVSNGFDFWFSKEACSLEECAAVALLDTLNAKIGRTAFRKLCRSTVVEGEVDGARWIPAFLASKPANGGEPVFAAIDKGALFPEPEAPSACCCPFHSGDIWDASRCEDIIEHYQHTQTFARSRIDPAPILMLGEEIFLDRSRFVVTEGAVHILSDRALTPVNFAACWNFGGSPEAYVDVAFELELLQPIVPPILFRETGGCRHLQFDFFRNSWMVENRSYRVPVPYISDVDPGDAEDNDQTPWTDAIDQASLQPIRQASTGPRQWWAQDSPAIRALYPDVDDG